MSQRGFLPREGLTIIIGGFIGVLAHALTGGKRDFSSVSAVRAQRYDVVADNEWADRAERELAAFANSGERRPRGET